LAEAFFGSRKKGAPKKWSADRLCRLLRHFHQLRKENLELAEELICQLVKNRFHGQYAGFSARTVRRNLQYARDPQLNPVLGYLYENYQAQMKRKAEAKHGGPFTSEIRNRLEKGALEKAIEQIASPRRNQASLKTILNQKHL
jgi:hypothetical protein